MGRSSVFVDVSSLNVMFKYDDKFVTALNYASGLQHLAEMMPALGTGYDIYLCMMPRAEGEGDMVIPELNLVGLPFTVDSLELYKLLSFFRESGGVGDVYLCNWLANYIACSRVSSFESVFYYGDRVAYIKVTDRLLDDFVLYESQLAFSESREAEYTGYGDVGLLDVDSLTAQYPELRDTSKAQLTALGPLVQCYKTPLKITTDELYEKLRCVALGEIPPQEAETVEPVHEVEEPKVQDPNTTPITDEIPEPPKVVRKREKPVPRPRQKTPLAAKVFLCISCVLAFTVGSFARIVLFAGTNTVNEGYFVASESRVKTLQQLTSVYSSGVSGVQETVDTFTYVSSSGLPVTLLGFYSRPDGDEVRCACASSDIANSYREYIEERYFVVTTNDLGTAEASDGTITYQFSIVFN